MKQWDIYLAELHSYENSHIQNGYRPVIIVSNNAMNASSGIVTIVPLTTRIKKTWFPTHVILNSRALNKTGMALCEQVMPLDKFRLHRYIGNVCEESERTALQNALLCQFDLAA